MKGGQLALLVIGGFIAYEWWRSRTATTTTTTGGTTTGTTPGVAGYGWGGYGAVARYPY
jgi:hypothetical protein